LRLLVELYHTQALVADGGISRKVIRRPYERERYGEYGRHVVWGFTKGTETASLQPCSEYFWQRGKTAKGGIWDTLNTLRNLGLLVEVAHLVENSLHECEILHPCAHEERSGEPLERNIAAAADAAGQRMLGHQRIDRGVYNSEILVPVLAEFSDAQLVGIYRLRYRPHTAATAAWMRELQEGATSWINSYNKLAAERQLDVTNRVAGA
jgi:hypothetical protein